MPPTLGTYTPPQVRLRYSVGSEYVPTDPFGRSELVIERDGAARLEQFMSFGRHGAWTGRVDPASLARLWAALERAGFPRVPEAADRLLRPDETMRRLVAEGDGAQPARQEVALPYPEVENLPGYDEAFALLDTIVGQLSKDIVQRTGAAETPIVAGIQRVT